MPIPAPKSVDDIISALNEHMRLRKKLGDMDRYTIQKRLDEALKVQPVMAYICLGIMATLDHNERKMRMYFHSAFSFRERLASVSYNYSTALLYFGCVSESKKVLKEMLHDELGVVEFLDFMAYTAIELGDAELSENILITADKLKKSGPNLRFLAFIMLLSSANTEEEEVELFQKFLSDNILREASLPLTGQQWTRMQNLADELKQYL